MIATTARRVVVSYTRRHMTRGIGSVIFHRNPPLDSQHHHGSTYTCAPSISIYNSNNHVIQSSPSIILHRRMSTALPYHLIVGMPALSPTMETGTISKWNVSAGDEFSAGDSLAVIETDKATIDFEAQDDGVVGKILVEAGGGEVAVGEPIMVTVEEKGDVGAFENFTVDSSAPAAAEPSAPAVSEPAAAPTSDLPYHLVVGMPALSPTMEAGTISKWNVATGDSFGAGDSLAVIETDKASMDFEAQDDGVVAKLLIEPGSGEITVGSPIMVTVEEEADVAAFKDFAVDAAPAAPAVAAEVAVAAAPAVKEVAPIAPTPPPAASVPVSAPTAPPVPVATTASPGGVIVIGGSPWGKLAAQKSPLAKALAAKQQLYIDTYGSTGHIPIV